MRKYKPEKSKSHLAPEIVILAIKNSFTSTTFSKMLEHKAAFLIFLHSFRDLFKVSYILIDRPGDMAQ